MLSESPIASLRALLYRCASSNISPAFERASSLRVARASPHPRSNDQHYATAAGRSAGFIQYEEELKTRDHACGLICVFESGGVGHGLRIVRRCFSQTACSQSRAASCAPPSGRRRQR